MEAVKLFFDGACLPFNPGGVATYGFVLFDADRVLSEGYGIAAEKGTNNMAEYTALVKGLEKALELGVERIKVHGDSQLVVNQMKGIYQVRSPNVAGLYRQAEKLSKKFSRFSINWIPREENTYADALSRKAFVSFMEKDNLMRAKEIDPSQIVETGPGTYRVKEYSVRTHPPFCTCPHFQRLNRYELLRKDNIIIRCKHILAVELWKKEG